jgi:hypothetical protein
MYEGRTQGTEGSRRRTEEGSNYYFYSPKILFSDTSVHSIVMLVYRRVTSIQNVASKFVSAPLNIDQNFA